jgi:hypothetical protein
VTLGLATFGSSSLFSLFESLSRSLLLHSSPSVVAYDFPQCQRIVCVGEFHCSHGCTPMNIYVRMN